MVRAITELAGSCVQPRAMRTGGTEDRCPARPPCSCARTTTSRGSASSTVASSRPPSTRWPSSMRHYGKRSRESHRFRRTTCSRLSDDDDLTVDASGFLTPPTPYSELNSVLHVLVDEIRAVL